MICAPRLIASTMTLLAGAVVFLLANAQTDSSSGKKTELSKTVLIVKDDSYMENAVSQILSDSLIAKGFTITTLNMESLKSEEPGSYRASIIFNAIHSSKITGVVRSFARALSAEQSNILICTVTGETWKEGKPLVDAVASATKNLNPVNVAGKILMYFNRIVETK